MQQNGVIVRINSLITITDKREQRIS